MTNGGSRAGRKGHAGRGREESGPGLWRYHGKQPTGDPLVHRGPPGPC